MLHTQNLESRLTKNIPNNEIEIYVTGKSCSGKTKMAEALAEALLGNYQEAIEYFHLQICREIEDYYGEANSLSKLGEIYSSWENYKKAIEYFQQSLIIYREIKDCYGEANSLSNLGEIYSSWENYEKAIEYFQQSLQVYREIEDYDGEANSLSNLGEIYSSWENYEKAIEYFQQSLQIYREIEDYYGEANSLSKLGEIYSSLENYQEAIEYFQQSLQICREIEDFYGEAKSDDLLGSWIKKIDDSISEELALFIEDNFGYHKNQKARTNEEVNITSPTSSSSLEPGDRYTIGWTDNFSDNIRLDMYKDFVGMSLGDCDFYDFYKEEKDHYRYKQHETMGLKAGTYYARVKDLTNYIQQINYKLVLNLLGEYKLKKPDIDIQLYYPNGGFTNSQKSLIQEYSKLANLPELSESNAERMGEILEIAESDDLLSSWIEKIDEEISERLGLFSEEK
ncbi:MAG: tetratricopeptide repeat protein, partial [Trichodesmium sp.]